ncbi:MAG: hypothetical protein WKG07_32340 [Hymenobacter sp.]
MGQEVEVGNLQHAQNSFIIRAQKSPQPNGRKLSVVGFKRFIPRRLPQSGFSPWCCISGSVKLASLGLTSSSGRFSAEAGAEPTGACISERIESSIISAICWPLLSSNTWPAVSRFRKLSDSFFGGGAGVFRIFVFGLSGGFAIEVIAGGYLRDRGHKN